MNIENMIEKTKKLLISRYPRFGGELAKTKIHVANSVSVAATDGYDIFVNPKTFESLSENDKLFVIAHEFLHIKFEHMFRLKTPDGKERDNELWNIATDAIINANLERDGFKIKEGFVNRPEALKYSAEEYYEILLKEKQQNSQNKQADGDNKPEESQESSRQGQSVPMGDDHNMWKKAYEKMENEHNEANNDNTLNPDDETKSKEMPQPNDGKDDKTKKVSAPKIDANKIKKFLTKGKLDGEMKNMPDFKEFSSDDHSMWEKAFEQKERELKDWEEQAPDYNESFFNEKSEFEKNRTERLSNAKSVMNKLRHEEMIKDDKKINFGKLGNAKQVIDWRLLLRREIEKTQSVWSQRRSVAENNYAYRISEEDVDDDVETEVMIDVSGSVSIEMIRAFLRQLKPLLKESKLKVGCFNERFWRMKEIKSLKDIDSFQIPEAARGPAAWTEDWDLAVRSFSKKREVNKIVFTDGIPEPGNMPKEDLKSVNVIWIVYGNKNFSPCCGKVIYVDIDLLQQFNLSDDDYTFF